MRMQKKAKTGSSAGADNGTPKVKEEREGPSWNGKKDKGKGKQVAQETIEDEDELMVDMAVLMETVGDGERKKPVGTAPWNKVGRGEKVY